MICDENYPSAPPKFFFISKINLPGVNQQTGELEPNFVPYLRDWSELYQKWLQTAPNTPDTMTLEAALLAIRK